MNSTKIILGGVVAGVSLFLLGWLIYGALLMDYMAENTNQCMSADPEDMNMGLMILSNLITGFLLAILIAWTGRANFTKGLVLGLVFGLGVSLGVDLMMHSMMDYYSSITPLILDVVGFAVMTGVAAGVAGWFMGRGAQ